MNELQLHVQPSQSTPIQISEHYQCGSLLVSHVHNMRLLHTREFRFKEFFDIRRTDPNSPKYAILSHRWCDEEITFQEFSKVVLDPNFKSSKIPPNMMVSTARPKAGYMKIMNACRKAASRNFDWIWIDTCCIDKTSSAELSEAINSMYRWYESSSICYVHLADVKDGSKDRKLGYKQFRKSVWFTRGWTLQELIAPGWLVFLDQDWKMFGFPMEFDQIVSEITGIPTDCLSVNNFRRSKSVATKMKWAANRVTSRVEDEAYCLLGLFEVNMPLLYRGGEKAFKRLQEEIIRQSDDETIFAHSHSLLTTPLGNSARSFLYTPHGKLEVQGVQMGVPEAFQQSAIGSSSFAVTNKGIQFRAAFVSGVLTDRPGDLIDSITQYSRGRHRSVIALNCHAGGSQYPYLLPVISLLGQRLKSVGDSFALFPRGQIDQQLGIEQYTAHFSLYERYQTDVKALIPCANEYLRSWIEKGGLCTETEPFVYRTIYLTNREGHY